MQESVNNDNRALLAKALQELKKSQAKIKQLEEKLGDKTHPTTVQKEAIAVVGMGCRFPGGADTPEKLWQLLAQGKNLVSEVPADRWDVDQYYDPQPGKAGKMYTRKGYFLDDVRQFDREFFNISPAESNAMDPQHRILMECSWEALEYAGYDPVKLRGSKTGVFIGAMNADYSQYGIRALDQSNMYTAITNGNGIGAGRLAHNFGFQGPAMAIDTLCSSSLVSVHLAVRSLQNRECELALAAGINLLLTPSMFIVTSASNMLAADGLCKTFDNAADGYARGEACGVIVLKRLTDAQRDRDNILAVIRGSAVNQDGPSSALPVPNGLAQEDVIRAALADGNVDAGAVSYIEAHGTGTALGDPIEIETLSRIFKSSRAENAPLLVGSIKTNFGHTEGAAGIAGLMKVILSAQANRLPAHLNVNTLSQHIGWGEMAVQVNVNGREWRAANGSLFAGVSAFGIGGTNAHIIVESANAYSSNKPSTGLGVHALTLSAKSKKSLLDLVHSYVNFLAAGSVACDRLCYTSNISRTGFNHRVSICAENTEDLKSALNDLANSEPFPSQASANDKNAFIFTGNLTHAQITLLAGDLLAQPLFKAALENYAAAFAHNTNVALLPLLSKGCEPQTDVKIQSALSAVFELAFADFMCELGFAPALVGGLGLGDYIAAGFAGVLAPVDVLRVVSELAEQSRIFSQQHKIYLVEIKCELRSAKSLLREFDFGQEPIGIVSLNAVDSTWLAGSRVAIDRACAAFEKIAIESRLLGEASAEQVLVLLRDTHFLNEIFTSISLNKPKYKFVSASTGQLVQSELLMQEYWYRQLDKPIKLKAIAETLASLTIHNVIQTGRSSVEARSLASFIRADSSQGDETVLNKYFALIPEHASTHHRLTEFVAAAWQSGATVNWQAFHAGAELGPIRLPGYSFQKVPCWLEYAASTFDQQLQQERRPVEQLDGNLDGDMNLVVRSLVASVKGLDVESVQPEHNFQEHLGYDSMSIMELKSLLEKNIGRGIKIDLKEMMMIQTVSQLIGFINNNQAGESGRAQALEVDLVS